MTDIDNFDWPRPPRAASVPPAMESTRRRTLVASLLGGAVLAGGLAAWAWQQRRVPAAAPHFVEVGPNAYRLPRPDPLARFALQRHDGQPFDNAALQGRWTFMIFGYTFCPDFCPAMLATFVELQALLERQPVQFVMVSVDPERDTPALLAAYVPKFHPSFIGATGDPAVIRALADSVGAMYARVPGSSERHYLIDHSTAVLLVGPQGGLQGIFAAPHVAAEMARGFAAISAPAA